MKPSHLIIALTVLSLSFSVLPTSVSAAASPKPASTAQAAKKAENLRAKIIKEIDRRTESLGKLATRINNMKQLSAESKTILGVRIQEELNKMTSYKVSVADETNLEKLRSVVQSLKQSHSIFALLVPQAHVLSASDRIISVATELEQVADKLSQRMNDLKAAGESTAVYETNLADMKNHLTNAKKLATEAQTLVEKLEPKDYPNNKTQLTSARQQLATARQDLAAAREDAASIVSKLKEVEAR